MKKIKVAYLPLYIKLYDDKNPNMKNPMVAYMKKLIAMIEEQGFEVVCADEVCRIKEEFDRAVDKFNDDPEIVAVITQHLAYSPSLESIDALARLKMPILVFDTTPDYEFLAYADKEDRIDANHGIHGVQDMCCMLKRRDIPYYLCVGHALHSNVVAELCGLCRAAYTARSFKNGRVGMIGGEFEGMGDFRITEERYEKEIGTKTIHLNADIMKKYLDQVSEEEIQSEIESDSKRFNVKITNPDDYKAAILTGLAIRKWIDDEKLDGITMNFRHTDVDGLPKVPFLECCKTMERGKGYAGEGDNLTAGLVAALIKTYPSTSFTEMFCADWEKDIIFLSHMGEINPALTAWTPTIDDKKFTYNSSGNTVTMNACYRKGKAVYVNLAPRKEGFALILSNVELTDDGKPDNIYKREVQGWMKPSMPVADFLKAFSLAGGTHHSALVYDVDINELAAFGKMMGFEVVII